MSEKIRDFIRAVENHNECEVKRTLKQVLQEKVLQRLRDVQED